MIVDDVEEDHQTEIVRGIDQRLQIVGRAIGGVRRERQHAVIAPVAPAGKIIDRHQLDRGDAEGGQARQVARNAAESAERPAMQLVEHRLRPRPCRANRGCATGRRADRRRYSQSCTSPACAREAGSGTALRRSRADSGSARRRRTALPPRTSHRRAAASAIDRAPSIATATAGLRRRKQAKARAIAIDQRRAERQCARKRAVTASRPCECRA